MEAGRNLTFQRPQIPESFGPSPCEHSLRLVQKVVSLAASRSQGSRLQKASQPLFSGHREAFCQLFALYTLSH